MVWTSINVVKCIFTCNCQRGLKGYTSARTLNNSDQRG